MTTIQELERNNGLLRQWCNDRDDRIRELESAISEMANAADDSGECEGYAHYGHMNVCRIRDRVMGGQKSAATEADRMRHALQKVTWSLGLAINGADASGAGHVENYLYAKSILANEK